MLHMLKMHWLFVLKAASSEGHSFHQRVGLLFQRLSNISALKLVVLLLFAQFYGLFCNMQLSLLTEEQRSIEALTGTCVSYQAKTRYRMKSWAEFYNIISKPPFFFIYCSYLNKSDKVLCNQPHTDHQIYMQEPLLCIISDFDIVDHIIEGLL